MQEQWELVDRRARRFLRLNLLLLRRSMSEGAKLLQSAHSIYIQEMLYSHRGPNLGVRYGGGGGREEGGGGVNCSRATLGLIPPMTIVNLIICRFNLI